MPRQGLTVDATNDDELPLSAESSAAMVSCAVQDHLLGKAMPVAHYGR
jgi:hypothetical protein